MYDIKNLNIWKEDSKSLQVLTRNKVKELDGCSDLFPIYMGKQLLDTDIISLNLSVRSYNCLKRTRWNTIGDIVNNIDSWDDLTRVRNLGKTSAFDIVEQIRAYQLSLFTKSELEVYERKCIEMKNAVSECAANKKSIKKKRKKVDWR